MACQIDGPVARFSGCEHKVRPYLIESYGPSVTASNEMEILAVLAFKWHIFHGPEEYLSNLSSTSLFKVTTGCVSTGSFDSLKIFITNRDLSTITKDYEQHNRHWPSALDFCPTAHTPVLVCRMWIWNHKGRLIARHGGSRVGANHHKCYYTKPDVLDNCTIVRLIKHC